MLRGVDIRAASFTSSLSPNRHAVMYTVKEWAGRMAFKDPFKPGYIDAMLYLSAAENKAVRIGMEVRLLDI